MREHLLDSTGLGPGERCERPGQGWRCAAWLAGLILIAALTSSGFHLIHRHLTELVRGASLEQSLRVLTWNIGKLYLQWESRAADEDLDHVAEVIREINPHVVALQELRDQEQMDLLLQKLGRYWHGRVPADSYDRRAGLLARLPAEYFDLPTSTGRTAQGATVTLPDRSTFTAISIHFDAFDPRRRLLQAEEILAGAQRLGAADLLVAGDINVDPDVAARGSIDQRLYHLLTRDFVDAGKDAGPTTIVSRRLDHLLHRSSRIRHWRATVLRGRRINIMDHDPLLVDLMLR